MRQSMATTWFAIMTFAALGALPGCDDGEETEDPEVHACEQVEAATTALEASATRDDTAPEVEISGAPYLIALPVGAPGYVRVEISGDTAALAFTLDTDVLVNLYHGDTEEGVTPAGANEACADDLEEHFDLDFHVAGTYYLELGPTASDSAWVLLMSAEGHVHED